MKKAETSTSNFARKNMTLIKAITCVVTTGILLAVTFVKEIDSQDLRAVRIECVLHKFFMIALGNDFCPIDQPLGTTKPVVAKGITDCALKCFEPLGKCLHFSFDSDNLSCILYYVSPSRFIYDPNCKFLVDPMNYEGCFATGLEYPGGCQLPFQYNYQQQNACISINGTTKPQCILPTGDVSDCDLPLGYTISRAFANLTIGSFVSGPLPCIANWFIIMSRDSSIAVFNTDWQSYKNGFGNFTESNYWIGLEKMYQITNYPGATYRLRVELQSLYGGQWYFAEFDHFRIDSEQSQYTLDVNGYRGNAGDSLSDPMLEPNWNGNGMKFSTNDSDYDLKTDGSCAQIYKGGWWFANCYYTCLTCTRSSSTFSWETMSDNGGDQSGILQSARMLISHY